MTRTQAYRWLQRQLNISREECHIGRFGKALCEKVVTLCHDQFPGTPFPQFECIQETICVHSEAQSPKAPKDTSAAASQGNT